MFAVVKGYYDFASFETQYNWAPEFGVYLFADLNSAKQYCVDAGFERVSSDTIGDLIIYKPKTVEDDWGYDILQIVPVITQA